MRSETDRLSKTVDGKQTDLFILKNENGVEIAVTNYGGAVLAIMAPDKTANLLMSSKDMIV